MLWAFLPEIDGLQPKKAIEHATCLELTPEDVCIEFHEAEEELIAAGC